MDDPATAFEVFRMHSEAAGFARRSGYTVLELGPGDSALTALFARSAGAARSILVDKTRLASRQLRLFAAAEAMLARKGLPVYRASGASSPEDVLAQLSCDYWVDGLASLQSLPSESVDFVFSNAVIEHIRNRDFLATARELYRIMAPDGVASHWIDYRDHLQDGLNKLRFSESMWESDFMANSGFYTNRIPARAIRELFESAGFEVEVRDSHNWPAHLPTPQTAMSKPYADMAPCDLRVMTNWLLLRKPHGIRA